MTKHPFGSLDREDRKQAYREASFTWFSAGAGTMLGVYAALLFWGVI